MPATTWKGATGNKQRPSPPFSRLLQLALCIAASAAASGHAQAGFQFIDQSNVFANRMATSAPVTMTGLGAPAAVTVAGGSYSVGCQEPFVSTPGTIVDGQSVCVRHVTSPIAGGTTSTVLTAGGASGTFTTTTAATDAIALIAGYYRSILRREADAGGLAFWESESRRMLSLGVDINEAWRAMAIAFFASTEYRGFGRGDSEFVVDLYATFFNRSPDAAGLSFWLGQIAQGSPRQSVLLAFLFSTEFASYTRTIFGASTSRAEVDILVDFYRGFLTRLPDTEGFRYWNERLRNAQCVGEGAVLAESEAISTLFLGSAEYTGSGRSTVDYLSDLYNGYLRRGNDIVGMTYWRMQLDTGALSREQVRRAFAGSPEFRLRVARVVAQGCAPSLATQSTIAASTITPGASPFIRFVDLQGSLVDRITSVGFTIAPKVGSASRPVRVTYSSAYLGAKGYILPSQGIYRVPVFGLYAGYDNAVEFAVTFSDYTVKTVSTRISTGAYVDPAATYDRPTIRTRRAPGTTLDFDFAWTKSGYGAPVVIDTDGEVRWTVPDTASSISTVFDGTRFIRGAQDSMAITRFEFDGDVGSLSLAAPFLRFHHNMAPGKSGYLGEVDEMLGGALNYENILVEFDARGQVIRQWRLADILSAYMASQGDDPSLFVRLGVDWFHMNSAIYDPSDDSLVVSSRENFVVKIDYQTGNIIWILGDPTKYWYTFPSLRARSLTLVGGGLYPIGQHALQLPGNGSLQLFNNGTASFANPVGTAAGESRAYSKVSAYAIDPITRTARETYQFDYGMTVRSPICSSAYRAGSSTLISYAYVDNGTHARLVGLDAGSNVVFEFEYPTTGCSTAFDVEPIEFHDLRFD